MTGKFDEIVSAEDGGEVIGWMPIDVAPKDKRIALYYPAGEFNEPQIVFGKWDNDNYVKNPKPYWVNDCVRLWGVSKCRSFSPIMWMEIKGPEHD